MKDCPCDPRLITQEWLHRQWHAANPGVRPTPWEAPRPPTYHRYPPGPLMARLCITFPLHDGYVSYPRQEAPMPAAPNLAALCAEYHAELALYRDIEQQQVAMKRRQDERALHIRELWAQIKELEAAQQGGRA